MLTYSFQLLCLNRRIKCFSSFSHPSFVQHTVHVSSPFCRYVHRDAAAVGEWVVLVHDCTLLHSLGYDGTRWDVPLNGWSWFSCSRAAEHFLSGFSFLFFAGLTARVHLWYSFMENCNSSLWMTLLTTVYCTFFSVTIKLQPTLYCEAHLLPLGPVRISIESTNIAALIFPHYIPQNDGGRVERRFCQDDFSFVGFINLPPKRCAECGQVHYLFILGRPLPSHLPHTCQEEGVSTITH